MNKDAYGPLGNNLSAAASDFGISDSYRWVRRGAVSLLFGYVAIVPPATYLVYELTTRAQGESAFRFLSLLGVSLASIFIAVGICLLAFSPQANERNVARKFLIAYGIAVVCAVLSRTMNMNWLGIAKGLAQTVGLHYLIVYFQVLAANRGNSVLHNAANLAKKMFDVLIFLLLASGFAISLLGVPLPPYLAVAGLCLGIFYFVWLKTLWHAYVSTRPTEEDL